MGTLPDYTGEKIEKVLRELEKRRQKDARFDRWLLAISTLLIISITILVKLFL